MKRAIEMLATASVYGLLISTSGLLAKFASKPSSIRARIIAKATATGGLVISVVSLLILVIINSFFPSPS